MKKYIVHLIFDGYHEIEVEAKNEKEAEELVMSGDYEDIIDKSDNYNVEMVEMIQQAEAELEDRYIKISGVTSAFQCSVIPKG